MTLKVLLPFKDTHFNNVTRNAGETFEASKERATELTTLKLVEVVAKPNT